MEMIKNVFVGHIGVALFLRQGKFKLCLYAWIQVRR